MKKGKKIITLCTSASFYKQAVDFERELKRLGFEVLVPKTIPIMKKNNDFNTEKYKTWYQNKRDYKKKTSLMRSHFRKVIKGDAVFVLNLEKKGIKGYIGGNALLEMLVGFLNKKPIFIYDEIHDDLAHAEEIYGLNPIFIDKDLSKIKF